MTEIGRIEMLALYLGADSMHDAADARIIGQAISSGLAASAK